MPITCSTSTTSSSQGRCHVRAREGGGGGGRNWRGRGPRSRSGVGAADKQKPSAHFSLKHAGTLVDLCLLVLARHVDLISSLQNVPQAMVVAIFEKAVS